MHSPESSPEDARAAAERDARQLAARYRYAFLDLASAHIDSDLFRSIPVDLMFRHHFVPITETNGTLEIAISDPTRLPELDEIAALLGRKLRISIATLAQINDLLNKTEQSQRVLEEVTEEFTLDVSSTEDSDETLSIDRLAGDSGIAPVIKLIDTTVFNALERRASDIHIETRNADVAIKYRIDGVLHHAMSPISKDWHETILSRIKVMSELDIAERRIPQDGRFRVRYKGRQIDFRVSIMPTVFGEDAVLRILDKQSMSEKFKRLSLEVVGFGDEDKARFARYIREPYGMVLVTGPTGSGKTTTLYAALSEIQSDEDKITIEDPVEYQLHGITQIPINEKKGLTFARGPCARSCATTPTRSWSARSATRKRPRSRSSPPLTGHLVFTTVHANNVVDVLGRFLNMESKRTTSFPALNCILAQRLVRVICTHCRVGRRYSAERLAASSLDPAEWSAFDFSEGEGCIECSGTGYRGRTAIHELLDMSDHIRELILTKRPSSEIAKAARREGMRTLRESAVERVRLGITTLREIDKVTFID